MAQTTEKVKHPKGLIAAALSNMGERFGFYTMMAILVLFLSAKFGLSEKEAGLIYSVFYFSIYALALLGGFIADKTKKYKATIMWGLVLMSLGYLLLAIPTTITAETKVAMLVFTCFALLMIAFGNGLFKGNLQALVGQMYDRGGYDNKHRDTGFSIFYMFINIGAIVAPWVAPAVRSWWLGKHGFTYSGDLPELAHMFINGQSMSAQQMDTFQTLADQVTMSGTPVTDLGAFSVDYLHVFNTGFHYSFAVAILAMAISFVIFIVNKSKFPDPSVDKVIETADGTQHTVQEMPAAEVRQRVLALIAVFAVVIFFWFSFHQNGLTLTYFARDFVNLDWFVERNINFKLTPEMFQSANPFFVVFLTPLVLSFFGMLSRRGREVTTPTKIAIGMGIAAFAFAFLALMSKGLPTLVEAKEMGRIAMAAQGYLVSPWVLVVLYLFLTIAELFISPLGLSFVSQVAPPKMQGLMQGAWLLTTGLGNLILFIGAIMYETWTLTATWLVFTGVCLISMVLMISMLGWLNRITGQDKQANK